MPFGNDVVAEAQSQARAFPAGLGREERFENSLSDIGWNSRSVVLDNDEHVPLWFSLASAHLLNGDHDQAAAWFERVSQCTTEHINWPIQYVRSFYFLGKIHEERGETEQARAYYQRFVDFWGEGELDRDRVAEARTKL